MKSFGLITSLFAACVMAGVTVAVTAQVAAPAAGGAPQTPGGGGGGRGPSAGSVLWNDKCAGCHAAGGRAPNLFDETWLSKTDDARMMATIRGGVAGTEMPAFGSGLTDLQTFQLVAHIRTATATARSWRRSGNPAAADGSSTTAPWR